MREKDNKHSGITYLDGCLVGQAVGEPEGVVDVVDVAAREAEVLLQLGEEPGLEEMSGLSLRLSLSLSLSVSVCVGLCARGSLSLSRDLSPLQPCPLRSLSLSLSLSLFPLNKISSPLPPS